ncbi:beta-galactosidase [Nesterenkonia xinjiangensis]
MTASEHDATAHTIAPDATSLDWPAVPGLAFGGDYNPEQWPLEVQLEDVELMGQAGVNLVSVGIFSWAMLEPREGEYDWGWLDDVLDRLHARGVSVALATATASPPPWLTHRHPEILPQDADGSTLWPGARQAYSISSPVFRDYALRMTRAVAERYAAHPALALWHVDNELGCHNAHDFSDDAAAAFRSWLEARYGTVEELNRAWGTAFWSQRYSSFDEILPPRKAPMFVNPTQNLDFHRYSSDELLAYFRDMKAILRELTPAVPVTTNFMCTTRSKHMDYFAWAADMDVIATDHYTIADDDERHIELAFSADLTRGVADGRPWMLMEHSTSAVNWQLHNRTKSPDEMLRDSLSHVARGADAVMFFQWRQSAAGAEKYHSAMVPHAGADTDVFRTTVRLGEILQALEPVRGSTVRAQTAVLFDYEAWWASELDSHPRNDFSYPAEVMHWYRALWQAGVTVDVVHPSADLSGYRAIVVPSLYLVRDEHAQALADAAEAGASVLITFFSGIVDEHDAVRLGGYPGAFRELLGIRTEEFWTLQGRDSHALDDGGRGEFWAEKTHLVLDQGATAVRSWTEGPLAGHPAVTRRPLGAGAAWYVGTRPDAATLRQLVDAVLEEAGVAAEAEAPEDVEVVRRHGEDGGAYLFVLNHTEQDAVVAAHGRELITGAEVPGELTVRAGEVAVVAEGR